MRGETCGKKQLLRKQNPFQSTRPVRGETTANCSAFRMIFHFNPLAPCGARPFDSRDYNATELFQSSRPVWDETLVGHRGPGLQAISILSPRTGRDTAAGRFALRSMIFQSTRPARGETRSSLCRICTGMNFNPLAPCGARR